MSEALTVVLGSDATIVNNAVVAATNKLLGDLDSSTALEDFDARETRDDDDDSTGVVGRVLEALNTPAFLVPQRIVVFREIQDLSTSDVDALIAWAESPTPSVHLLVSLSKGSSKSKIAKAAGELIDVSVGTRADDKRKFVEERFTEAKVNAAPRVYQVVADRVGDDLSQVESLAHTLYAAFGEKTVSITDVEPYLGAAGDVPEWDLTDAIDQGQASQAIVTARRMLDSEGRVGVQVINILQRHYLKMARLEGSGATSGEEAAAIIGGHAYPAQKLVRTARILGSDRIASAIEMVTRADLDVKGGADYGGSRGGVDKTSLTVVEVLVARLAKMSESARRP